MATFLHPLEKQVPWAPYPSKDSRELAVYRLRWLSSPTVVGTPPTMTWRMMAIMSVALIGCGPSALVRERAAHDFRCPEDRTKVKKVSGSAQGGATWEAQGCNRTGLYNTFCHPQTGCLVKAEVNAADLNGSNPAPAPAPPPPPEPQKDVAPPDGLAGFRFGMSAEDAEAACTEAEHSYTVKDGSDAACSATVASVGFESGVDLDFCDGKLCRIRVAKPLEGIEEPGDAVKVYKKMFDVLNDKYGKPSKRQAKAPSKCEDLNACIEDGSFQLRADWNLDGHRVRLKLISGPGLLLDYRAPKQEKLDL